MRLPLNDMRKENLDIEQDDHPENKNNTGIDEKKSALYQVEGPGALQRKKGKEYA